MHHQQYITPLPGSSSSSTGGSPTTAAQVQAAAAAAAAAQAAANMPLIASIANVKDSRWLTLEVCREYQRGKCTRSEQECKFAHPPTHVEVNSGKVIACFDSLKGKCNRTNPPCKYLHPPQHLRDILLQNGRNNLILRSIAMNIAANQSIYPQTAAHMPYHNGAIIQNPMQQPTSLPSYHHIGPTAPGQSALLFNPAGQAFSIPLHAAHLQQLSQATPGTPMFSSDGAQYFQPVTQLTAQATGQKPARTDRLEVYPNSNSNHDALKVCSDFQHGQCLNTADTCPLAHPQTHCPLDTDGLVIVCVDYIKGKCIRDTCKYFHPPEHLVTQLKAIKAQSAAVAAQVFSNATATTIQYSPSTLQFVHPLTLNSSQSILAAPHPTTYTYPQRTSTAPACSSPLQQQNTHEDDGSYANGFVSSYQPYPGAAIQTIYTQTGSVDLKDSLINSTNGDTIGRNGSSSSSSSSSTGVKAVIDPVSSSSITHQTKKRPLEEDTATTGAYLQLPPGTQLIAAPPHFVQQQSQQQQSLVVQHQQQQKRSAVADPKTGIPMAAYPLTAFSYPSPSPLPIQFQQQYLTAVPMTSQPQMKNFKSWRCTQPQCKYVHLIEDFVEVNNDYVSICKEAILGNYFKNKFGIRTLPALS
ncbi:unnamed protein product [Rotaria sordida]|uniref:C3H1-type domain-containing protein n=1 Tax=Rotaria sordida TaxID=392033 RepID=A0A813WJ56_9BILA|nr:unnamed protein product [Rotaria sordida]CAF0856161.1 unnamed protein product [Rotaria sordida]